MPARAFILLACLLFCGTVAAQQTVQLEYKRVEQVQNRVMLIWQTVAEPGVAAYEIRRRTPTSMGLVLLQTVAAHGVGKPYTYTDTELYKETSDMADYDVTAVYQNGTRSALFTAQVNYTTTGLRRTWGSLKAMFQ